MKKRNAFVALTAFVVGLFPLVTPASAHCGDAVQVRLRTFHVEAEWVKKSYKIGQMAKMKVHVTRPSKKDPVSDGDGIDMPTESPVREPAEGVTLGLGLYAGQVYLSSAAVTDDEGNAVVKLPLPDYTDPGNADSQIYAYLRYFQTDDIIPSSVQCAHIEEYGMLDPGPGVKIGR